MNAPFSWPNSSLSISSVGIAAQFTLTNGPAGKRAFGVDVRGQQFLAGAGFAGQQHARVAARGHGGLFQNALEGRARPDHARAAHQFAQPPILLAQLGFVQRVPQRQQNVFAAQRLFEKIERARARGFHRVGDGPVARDHDHRRVIVVGLAASAAGRCRVPSGSRTSSR